MAHDSVSGLRAEMADRLPEDRWAAVFAIAATEILALVLRSTTIKYEWSWRRESDPFGGLKLIHPSERRLPARPAGDSAEGCCGWTRSTLFDTRFW